MDCDDVNFLFSSAARELTAPEEVELEEHLDACDSCRALRREVRASYRWIARLPENALDDPDLLVLPTVDPAVLEKQDELATGGMGRVTRARDRRLGRDVAVKELLDALHRPRFEREVRITARLQHPSIVSIYEAGTWPDGGVFYTMRLVPGRTLGDAIEAAPTLEARLALLPHAIAATDAVAFAHAQRIVHRDLKPNNVLVGEFGETVVIDWGLAKELDDAAVPVEDLTRAGSVIGTPGFMPPEQALGQAVDERADVYALGALLYNLLGGTMPYDSSDATPESIIVASCQGPPRSLDELAPDAPADLRALVERAMARRPEERYPTAKELADDLHRFAAGKLLGARAYTTRELIAHWIRRHRAIAAAVAVAIPAVAIAATVAVLWMARSLDSEHRARLDAEEARRTIEHGRDELDHTFAAALEEQGRSELIAGDASRALPYLAAAYARGRDGVALRQLLAIATGDGAIDRVAHVDGASTQLAGARAITNADGNIVVRRVDTGVIESTIHDATAIQVGHGGTLAITTDARLIDLDTGATRAHLPADGATGFELARGGRHVVSHGDAWIRVYDIAAGTSSEIAVRGCERATISRDGELVAGLVGGELRIWRASAEPIATIPAPHAEQLAFDPSGGRVLVYGGVEPVLVDAHRGTTVATLHQPASDAPITTIQFDDIGRRIASGAGDGTASLWDADSGARLVHEAGPSYALGADGARLATAAADGAIRIWEGDSARLLATVAAGSGVRALAWSTDGTRLMSEAPDGATLWDVHLETRTRDAISALAARTGDWVLDGARLRRR